jgi:hypothetical protein
MLEKIGGSLKPRRCVGAPDTRQQTPDRGRYVITQRPLWYYKEVPWITAQNWLPCLDCRAVFGAEFYRLRCSVFGAQHERSSVSLFSLQLRDDPSYRDDDLLQGFRDILVEVQVVVGNSKSAMPLLVAMLEGVLPGCARLGGVNDGSLVLTRRTSSRKSSDVFNRVYRHAAYGRVQGPHTQENHHHHRPRGPRGRFGTAVLRIAYCGVSPVVVVARHHVMYNGPSELAAAQYNAKTGRCSKKWPPNFCRPIAVFYFSSRHRFAHTASNIVYRHAISPFRKAGTGSYADHVDGWIHQRSRRPLLSRERR